MDNKFLDEFYKILLPVERWDGKETSLKEVLEAKLAKHGITRSQAAKLLNMQRRSLDRIVNGTAPRIDVVDLLKLGQFLGLETTALLRLFLYELPVDRVAELEDARKKSFILARFEVKRLVKSGFLCSGTDLNYIENRIVSFFSLRTIFEYSSKQIIPAFIGKKKDGDTLMREFWVRSAYARIEHLGNPFDYNRARLVDLTSKIRPYTLNVAEGLRTVIQALYSAGVSVIWQPNLSTTTIRGATLVIDGRPGIVLTDLNKTYAAIWFALLHELHHVLYDLGEIKKEVFHLTGDADLLLLQEDKANEFARNYFLPHDKAKFIYKYIDSSLLVNNFAKDNQIHSSLIYHFYCADMEANGNRRYWAKYKQYQPDINLALKDLKVNPFDKDRVADTVQSLQEHVFNF